MRAVEKVSFEAVLSPARDWILDEHRLSTAKAFCPEPAISPCSQKACANSDFQRVHNRGLDLHPATPRTRRADHRVSVGLEPDAGTFKATVRSTADAEPRAYSMVHADARIIASGDVVRRSIDIKAIAQRCGLGQTATGGKALRSAQEAHLRFGPHWQVLQSIALGFRKKRWAFLKRPEHATGTSWSLDAGLFDIATGSPWNSSVLSSRARPLVPISYGRIKVYSDLPEAVWSCRGSRRRHRIRFRELRRRDRRS